ncbi:unnamed protein product [Adineta ricciae]|uniref:NAD(+)--protein-arginine ADP-ribosyltransferase n=1 Tax=Adineta ricciae TaxID=249248 RepID=A0A814N0R5_ADIRI|nr:unnamed protein product [Adineta ricciae]
MGQTSSTNSRIKLENTSSATPSEFYLACRNGDVELARKLLAQLHTGDINRLEPNGSTVLHAASFYGHRAIVEMLLQHGAKPWLMNKYQMTPYEEAANEEIRLLFHRPLQTDISRFFDDDDVNANCLELISERSHEGSAEHASNNIPNGWVSGYKLINKYFRSKDIKLIVRAQIIKYYLARMERSDDSARQLQKLLKQSIPYNHRDYRKASYLFDEFCSRNNIEYLIRLYTLETDFYGALHSNVEIFTIEIYSQLQTLNQRFFQGQSYRGLSMANKDISEYEWAAKNPGTLIEIKTLTSTSVDPQIAYEFARNKKTNNSDRHRVICQFQFGQQCCTAVDLRRNDAKKLLCLSAYENESEVLVLPGTLFEVHDVRRDSETGRYTISLQNIHVPLRTILDALKYAEA